MTSNIHRSGFRRACTSPIAQRSHSRGRFIPFDQIAPAYTGLGTPIVVLLADRIRTADDDPDNAGALAYSSTWRPAIERGGYHDDRDELLSALRDAFRRETGGRWTAVHEHLSPNPATA